MTLRFFDIDGNEIDDTERTGSTDIQKTYIDGFCVSTVHLGMDHSFDGGPSLTFETMIFPHVAHLLLQAVDEFQERYHTLEEAKKGHGAAIDWLRRVEVWK